tara:strand:+ start:5744 stop:6016 length:273 start_codon:yes stop_codon:yes gene_type:complete
MIHTIHIAKKVSSRKDVSGMNVSSWTYRGVFMKYYQTTQRRSPWHVIVSGKKTWWQLIGDNKVEMMERVDEFIDERGYEVEGGKLRRPNN